MEKREFASISLYLKGRMRLLTDKDEPSRFSGFGLSDSANDVEELTNSHTPEAMVSFLLNMNAKLDAILSHLKHDQLEEDFPNRIEILELSGSQVTVRNTNGLSEGAHLELLIFLSDFPLSVAGACGKVIKADPKTATIEFGRISAEDREKIVHHVFVEERRQIRTQRLA
ncbi:hypothetical protein [Halodesulfovibrio spirochaetisodalis]|uniref:PilZ domain-containing protein n=1 Tax=Halodesulfovibrio spirochaetisodalis TaxID=1560234 RepID=A0A1B7XJI0_9BACT|nr:hypothetical protein [Halodesulfovibrio spirochaetisodalis]OBQ55687.1 hypothetical protein SP90_03395 [Halodesulfovibrio spirochaetisodalis]